MQLGSREALRPLIDEFKGTGISRPVVLISAYCPNATAATAGGKQPVSPGNLTPA